MATEPRLIVQVPIGSAVERQLRDHAPSCVASGAVVVIGAEADARGNLEATTGGEVVLSVPSPEGLTREPDAVGRVIALAGTGVEPLVVVVEAAEELREEELDVVLEAAGHNPRRAVILRIVREG